MTKSMSILIVLGLCLLPLSAQAVDVPLFSSSSRILILLPMPDVVYFYDERGNSIIFYRQWSGLAWYSAQDSTGRILHEGYGVAPPFSLDPREMPAVDRTEPAQDRR